MNRIQVAKVRDAHGLKGELFVVSFSRDCLWIEKCESFWLKEREFRILSFRRHKNGVIAVLEGIGDRTEAEKWIGFPVEIETESLISKKGENLFLREIEGFEVVQSEQSLGPIVGFSSNGVQDLLQVETLNGVQEIPLIPEFLVEIQWSQKKLFMNLPEGLIQT